MLAGRLFEEIIKVGTLRVIDASGRLHEYGTSPGPVSTIRLHDKSLNWKIFLRPEMHIGEAYMNGKLTVEDGDIYDFLDLCGRNMARFESHWVARWSAKISRVLRYLHQYNPIGRAEKNVAHHYDLSGGLYDLFLDNDRQYSCAYFSGGNDSLEVAQDNKKRHIAAKLMLSAGQRILDIGSGWGGMGIYLAKVVPGTDVTGVTLSREQFTVSNERAADEGLRDRVRFKLQDYREESSRYDRIVSVGMFEHVGSGHYLEFFAKIRELLAEDGVMLLHSIGRMEPPGSTNPWLRKYIFPGGYTPALSETLQAIEKSGLWVTDIEILRLHYAETLKEWRRRFLNNREKVLEIYDERFFRMWDFYLAGCEMSFRHMNQMVFQIQIARRQDAVPLTRDYIGEWERQHTGIANRAA